MCIRDSKIPYGIRYRCNGGYGFWQQAVCCTDDLTADNFELALATMQGFKADGGRPLGLGFGGKAGTLQMCIRDRRCTARIIALFGALKPSSSKRFLRTFWHSVPQPVDLRFPCARL